MEYGTVTAILGLPGSGKTTKAKAMQVADPELVRVNKDDLRSMLFNGVYSQENERLVRKAQADIIREAVGGGCSIVIDDAGLLSESTMAGLAKTLEGAGLPPENLIIDRSLIEVPLEVCIAQDLARLNSVGESVIRKFHDRYLPKKVAAVDPTKPDCFVMDVDGCLAQMAEGRDIFDHVAAIKDKVHEPIATIVNSFGMDSDPPVDVFILTGRDEVGRDSLIEWMDTNFLGYGEADHILMRKEGDRRPADEFKKEALEGIMETHNILFVVDDDETVIRMAQGLGLKTIQPNFL